MLTPCESLTTLMIVQLPMTFQLTWIFIFMCFHWTSSLQYILFTIYMAHNSEMAYDNSRYDLTWHCWHGLAWWCSNAKLLLLLSDGCVLGYAYLLLHISWWWRVFNYLQPWKVVANLCSFFLLFVDPFIHLDTNESLGILPSTFFIISPWLDSVTTPAIHSWRDNINLKTPYPKMMHYYPWIEPRTSDKLGERA